MEATQILKGTDQKKKSVDDFLKMIGLPLALLVFLGIFFMPSQEGLTVQGQKTLAVFLSALVLWVTNPLPAFLSALITIIALTLTGAAKETAVLGTFGLDVIWLMLSAFVLTSAMEKSQLARRFSLWAVIKFGKKAKITLLVFIGINTVLAFFIPSTTARAALLLPLATVLVDLYKEEGKESNFAKAMMIQGVQANSIATSGILTATAANIMVIGFIKEQAGYAVTYTDWFFAAMPTAIITLLGMWIVGMIFFPPEKKSIDEKALQNLKNEYITLGNWTSNEKKAAGIFLLTVLLWITGAYHKKMFGFTISVNMVAIIGATLTFMPKIGLLAWKETKIPWDLMIFSAGAYAVGNALEKSGAAAWMINNLVKKLNLETLSPLAVYIVVILIAMFSHFLFTSKTVRTTIIIPATIVLAKTLGMNPVGLALAAGITMTYSITLPPHSKPNLIYYGTGHFKVLEMLTYGIVTCIIGTLTIIIGGLTWFNWIGLPIFN